MQITAVKRQKRRQGRVNLYVDGEFRIALAAEVAMKAGLRRGIELDAARLEQLERDDAAWRAREAALRLLSFRQRSEGELRQRLGRKGFDAGPVDEAIAALRSAGLIDDSSFALAFARDRLRSRPSGPLRLSAELRSKGVDAATVERLVSELYVGDEELDFARRAMRKFARKRSEDPRATRRRLYGFLARRGFTSEVIAQVMEEEAG